MTFLSEHRNGNLVLRLSGDLIGEHDGAGIIGVVTDALNNQVSKCVIDISNLRYINSSGIGVLITILTKFRNKGGEVFLLNPSESVKKLLVITKLNSIFQVIQSETEAV